MPKPEGRPESGFRAGDELESGAHYAEPADVAAQRLPDHGAEDAVEVEGGEARDCGELRQRE